MSIHILTEGGRNIGLGHITRCISIAQAFEHYGHAVEMILNADESVRKLPGMRRLRILDWLHDKTVASSISGSDIVIIDSYLAGRAFYRKVSERTKKAVFMDDNMRLAYPRGMVVNGTVGAEVFSYPKTPGIRYLLGSSYIPLRKEFWNNPRRKTASIVRNILVTFGGNDADNTTMAVTRVLDRQFPEVKKHIVIGKSFLKNNIAKIRSCRFRHCSLYYSLPAGGMKRLMQLSDIAVSAGGQTLYELAAVGVPTVAVQIAGNQLNNVKGWLKAGFIEFAGRHDSRHLEKRLALLLDTVRPEKIRKKMSKAGQNAVDGKGALRIARVIIRYGL